MPLIASSPVAGTEWRGVALDVANKLRIFTGIFRWSLMGRWFFTIKKTSDKYPEGLYIINTQTRDINKYIYIYIYINSFSI